MTGLFERVILWTNVENMVSIVCQQCRYLVSQSEKAYTRQMMGEGLNYR